MKFLSSFIGISVVILFVILAVACTVLRGHKQDLSNPQLPTPSPEPNLSVSPTITNTPESVLETTPGESIKMDDVELNLSRITASPGQPITVTITNHSSSLIATFDHKSLCSIFSIQKRSGEGWENVLECYLRKPTVPVIIQPGDSKSLTFNGGPHFLDPGALDPGEYQVEFEYKQIEDVEDLSSDVISWHIVYSPTCTVNLHQ